VIVRAYSIITGGSTRSSGGPLRVRVLTAPPQRQTSERFELVGGVVLLAIATNLPEIAMTISTAISGHVEVAVGNILGGIAIQTVVLDALGGRPRKPRTYIAASLILVLEGALDIAVLLVVVAGTQLPNDLIVVRLTPTPVLILILWIVGLALIGGPASTCPGPTAVRPPTVNNTHAGTPTPRPRRTQPVAAYARVAPSPCSALRSCSP